MQRPVAGMWLLSEVTLLNLLHACMEKIFFNYVRQLGLFTQSHVAIDSSTRDVVNVLKRGAGHSPQLFDECGCCLWPRTQKVGTRTRLDRFVLRVKRREQTIHRVLHRLGHLVAHPCLVLHKRVEYIFVECIPLPEVSTYLVDGVRCKTVWFCPEECHFCPSPKPA